MERCLQEKCDEWQTQSADKWAKAIAVRIPEKLRHVWKCLSSWAVLHTYPQELLEYVLAAQDVMWVASVPAASVAGIPIEPEARDEGITQIDLFFNKITPQVETREDFLKVLGFVSGRVLLEFKHIQELIKSGQFKVTMEDVRKVREIFKQCPGVTASRLKLLDHCVMPARPRLLADGTEWSTRDWIAWTTKEYIPYRAWQVYNRHYDEELEATVKRFSDWYLQEYTAIQQDMELSLVHSLSGIQVAGSDNKLILILVLDGLSVQFMGLVDQALHNFGFSLHGSQYRYAPLPTITERNKGLVLSGAWDYSEKSYENILKARAKSDWDDKKVIYLSSLKGLSDLQFQLEPSVVVLNSIDSDDLLHEDLEAKNTTHEEELQRLFDRLAETVDQLAGAWTGKKEDFYVYVVTDHGACRILDEEKHTLDAGVISKLFPDEKYRFAELSEQQACEVPENLWALGHKFQQPFIAEDKIYFIPRGHNTVRLPGKKSVFVHGGAAPEEVIVPTYLYKPVEVAWKKPAARFLQLELDQKSGKAKFYVQRIVPLEVEIQNPNTAELQVLRVSVVTPDTEIKGYQLPVVGPLATGVLKLDCYFKKAALNENSLEIEIVYEIAGGTHTTNAAVASEFKSAMTTGFSLKDL
ncbi:hypothetical protein [Desulfoferrobacter suflitae]|uniref:hypothetical protein n=1 Tax=Desulfoferrobacter suflitae TaxID=2865782 RepID=UPI002164326A|nr:hypothetical protein [Desulfoferrobacter suflitae]MCK8604115.1 hypothetical protein [Desulfoferrobacter suflitae]